MTFAQDTFIILKVMHTLIHPRCRDFIRFHCRHRKSELTQVPACGGTSDALGQLEHVFSSFWGPQDRSEALQIGPVLSSNNVPKGPESFETI